MTDLYDILGVPTDANTRAIKSAFRRKAREHHPDLNPNDARAEARFIELAAAFEVLSDADQRALYDEFGLESLREDFDAVRARWERARTTPHFNTPPAASRKQEDDSWAARFRREYDTQNESFRTTFERAFRDFNPFASERESEFYEDVFVEPGQDRRDTLELDMMAAMRGGSISFEARDGAILTVRVPAGVEDGETLLVAGEGEPSQDGGAPGDLWLTVKITLDELFERDGLDLSIRVPVTMSEAILGARIELPTPHGPCVMTLPEGIQSGAKLRLRHMGGQRDQEKGDLYAIIEVRSPTYIDDAIRAAAETLQAGYQEDVRAKFSAHRHHHDS